ncbi:MAG TPA: phospholipid carrier-dependent glycosyltransferase [Anaeromyxobacter sp.]|nr:phospholipid carrier-dependent glycosyltransferase [Anaeromyxobacter sp.]
MARPPFWLAILALTGLALLLRTLGLAAQPLVGDDVWVRETARNFAAFGWPDPTMWNHPRLRDLLVHASLGVLGDGAWGIRAWSVLLGTLSVPAIAVLVRCAGGSAAAALVAALLVATDPLHLDFSRQGINDVYLAFFPVAAVTALLVHRERRHPGWLVLAGLLLGLGLASKWNAVFPVGVAAAVVLVQALRGSASRRERAAELALFLSCLVLLPLAVYVLTYWPWLGRGHDLAELLRFHGAMAFETSTHTGYPGTKQVGFPGEVVGAWRWFVQPSWFVDYVPPPRAAAVPARGFFLSGVANPLAWLATLPAAAWAAARWIRERDRVAGWLLLLFLAAYLPFVLVPRPIWTNSALAVVPYSSALVAWTAVRLHERCRHPVRIWLAVTLVLAAFLWPPAMGISTRPTDAVLRALVSPLALDPSAHRGS